MCYESFCWWVKQQRRDAVSLPQSNLEMDQLWNSADSLSMAEARAVVTHTDATEDLLWQFPGCVFITVVLAAFQAFRLWVGDISSVMNLFPSSSQPTNSSFTTAWSIPSNFRYSFSSGSGNRFSSCTKGTISLKYYTLKNSSDIILSSCSSASRTSP